MPVTDQYPTVEVTSRRQWRAWLQKHHASSPGIWLVTYKKVAGKKHLPYAAAVEEALCFGWIDSLPRKLDDERTMLLYTPRKPGSVWSAVNKARIERLTAEGKMTDAGGQKIDAAKADGSWDTLSASDALIEPDDLQKALRADSAAICYWRDFPASARKATLEWIYAAKRPETRAARIAETVQLSAQNIRPRDWRAAQQRKRS